MIVDSSALLAIMPGENDAKLTAESIAAAEACKLSAANRLETAMMVDGCGLPEASIQFETLLQELLIEVVPVDARIASLARAAHRQFGRGNHPTRLNFGGCMSYALAEARGEPLLFKGNDFSQADITPALRP